MRLMPLPSAALLLGALAVPALAATVIERRETATIVAENVPAIPESMWERLNAYQNTRAALSAGWVADGRGQFVLTRFAATTQVHWVRAPGAAREQLTFFEESIAMARANPRRNGFLFGRDVGGSEFWQLFWFDLDTRQVKMLTDGDSRNEKPVWSSAGDRVAYSTTRRNGTDSDIHIVGLDGAPSRALLERGGSWYAQDFSSDDRRLLVQRYLSINHSEAYVLDLETGALTPLHDPERPAAHAQLAFALDNRAVVYTSDQDDEFRRLRLRDLDTGRVRTLSADIDWDVKAFVVSPDGSRVAFVSNQDGWSTARLIALPGGEPLPLPALPRGVATPIAFSPDGRSVAFTAGSAAQPGDAWSLGQGADAPVRWTWSDLGGLRREELVEPALVRYRTFDTVDGERRTIPAFYYAPPAARAEAPVPVVIQIHGGPESQALPVFSPDIQFLVRELGVAVLVPNVRGSDGYGRSYLLLDNGDQREDPVRDIGALLDWVKARPELDHRRVGVYGGSYGGFMVLASLARYDHRLRAGVDVVGISNFVTFLENTQDYRRDLRRAEYGDERDPKMRRFLKRISPTTRASRISTPLLVAQGANDPRVPASESEQIVRTVRGNGTEVWYLLFRDEGHGFRKKPNRDLFSAAMMMFWQKHLLDGRAASAAVAGGDR
ncbi:MAG TPA: alpha/beta fold hydrolase [Xanthomonadaceae bacterium]|nr:alpha/beta fold hydrolase [Xanthomonadaceae bacterium]